MIFGRTTILRSSVVYDEFNRAEAVITPHTDALTSKHLTLMVLHQLAKMLYVIPRDYPHTMGFIHNIFHASSNRLLTDPSTYEKMFSLTYESMEPRIRVAQLDGKRYTYSSRMVMARRGNHGFYTSIPRSGGTTYQALHTPLLMLKTILDVDYKEVVEDTEICLHFMSAAYLEGYDYWSLGGYASALWNEAIKQLPNVAT